MSDNRMTIKDMFALIGVATPEEYGSIPFPGHVATDSRYVEPGGAFVALEGERVDGHNYIPQAIENGAELVIVRRGHKYNKTLNKNIPCVELDEPEPELAQMASAYLKKANIPEVVAVTGSVGKTTTRAALQNVLGGHFRLHSSVKSLNTRIGCTATVLAMPLDTELLLLEFGANKPGEIAELTELFPPTTAIITQVASVHLEGFGSIEGVLSAKTEILRSSRLGRFIYNADNELLSGAADKIKKSINCIGVGTLSGADFLIKDVKFNFDMENGVPTISFRLDKREGGNSVSFNSNVWGTHLAVPIAFAASTGNTLGISLDDCAAALKGFTALNGRGRVLQLSGGRFVIDDAYNANPLSMKASVETFAKLEIPNGKSGKMAVLGEMKEMGPDAAKYHKEIAPLLNAFDNVVLIGDIWSSAIDKRPGLSFAAGWQEALDIVNNSEWRGLLVKGSNSIGLQNLVNAIVDKP